MGGVGGRLEPCEGHRWLWCALKRRYAWWWGGGIDVVHERGSGIIGILRRHTWSQRHTCGHRAATCGPRGALGAIHVAAHRMHGEGCTRRARGRSEQRATDASKNIGVFCGYALVAGLSRGYTCICGQGVAHAAVEGSQRAARRSQSSWWPEGVISIEEARPHRVFNPSTCPVAYGDTVSSVLLRTSLLGRPLEL